MTKFNEDGTIKSKIYPPNCIVKGENQWPIILITYNKCNFSANNGVKKAWT